MMEPIVEMEKQQIELRELRETMGLNRRGFAEMYGIPVRTIEDWEYGKRKMPVYLLRLLAYKVKLDALSRRMPEQKESESTGNVNVICDVDGKLYLYDFVRTKKETSSPLEQ